MIFLVRLPSLQEIVTFLGNVPPVLYWSAFLSITNLAVFALAGRESRRARLAAWWLTIATEPGWAIFGYLTGGWFFVALAVFYTAVAVWNLHTMRGENKHAESG